MRYIDNVEQNWCESCAESTFWCERCEQTSTDDNYGACIDDQAWCQGCVSDDAFQCNECGEHRNDDDSRTVLDSKSNESQWCESCADNGATSCESCCESVQNGHTTKVLVATDLYGDQEEQWCNDCADSDSTDCADNDCEAVISTLAAPSAADGEQYCDDCIDAHRSTRERLQRDYERLTQLHERTWRMRRRNWFPSRYPVATIN
jgi:hypothetical protein